MLGMNQNRPYSGVKAIMATPGEAVKNGQALIEFEQGK